MEAIDNNEKEKAGDRISVHISISPEALVALDEMAQSPRKRGAVVERLILEVREGGVPSKLPDEACELTRIYDNVYLDGRISMSELGLFHADELGPFLEFLKANAFDCEPPLPLPAVFAPAALSSSPLLAMALSHELDANCRPVPASATLPVVRGFPRDVFLASPSCAECGELLDAGKPTVLLLNVHQDTLGRPLYVLKAKRTLQAEEAARYFLWCCAAISWECEDRGNGLAPIQALPDQLWEAYRALLPAFSSPVPPQNVYGLASTAWARLTGPARVIGSDTGAEMSRAVPVTEVASLAADMMRSKAPGRSVAGKGKEDGKAGAPLPQLDREVFSQDVLVVSPDGQLRQEAARRILEEGTARGGGGIFIGDVFARAAAGIEGDGIAVLGRDGNASFSPLAPIEGIRRSVQIEATAEALYSSLLLPPGFARLRKAVEALLWIESYMDEPSFAHLRQVLVDGDTRRDAVSLAMERADAEGAAVLDVQAAAGILESLRAGEPASLSLRLDQAVEAERLLAGRLYKKASLCPPKMGVGELAGKTVVFGSLFDNPFSDEAGPSSGVAAALVYALFKLVKGRDCALGFDLGALSGARVDHDEFAADAKSSFCRKAMVCSYLSQLPGHAYREGGAYDAVVASPRGKRDIEELAQMLGMDEEDVPCSGRDVIVWEPGRLGSAATAAM